MKDLEKIITKELLKKILPKEIENLSDNFSFYIDEDNIVFNDDGEMQFEYCIYKFAFRCKEWTYSTYGIMIQSYPYCGKSRADALKGLEVDEVFKENTEVEAIIQACEWILEYKKNQCTK